MPAKTLRSQVMRKAKTIMRQVDEDGNDRITLPEFHVVAARFPNILFPPELS